jgi:hypothetical protein
MCSFTIFSFTLHPNGIWSCTKYPDVLQNSSEWWIALPFALVAVAVYSVGYLALVVWCVVVAPRRFGASLHFRELYGSLWEAFDCDGQTQTQTQTRAQDQTQTLTQKQPQPQMHTHTQTQTRTLQTQTQTEAFDSDSWWFCLVNLAYGLCVNFIPIVVRTGRLQFVLCVLIIVVHIKLLSILSLGSFK